MPLFSSLKSAPISTRVKGKEVVEQIPDDVIEQILVRLPVKSVLRFRCACKSWHSFISDPKFSKLHQIRTCILISSERPHQFLTINIESFLRERADGTAPTPTPLFPFWLCEADDNCYSEAGCSYGFLGSSNGLICVDQFSNHIPDRRGLILWNPSTRKIKRLPPARRSPALIIYAGFGYDESVDDYKLVWVRHTKDYDVGQVITELDVYSLKSNTWSIYPPLNISFGHISYYRNYVTYSYGVLSNGAIHWIVDHYRDSSQVSSQGKHIVALDLATEKFRFMAIPPSADRVWSLEGSLCLYYYDWERQIDLWVMKEYGVDSSWTKLVSIPHMTMCCLGAYTVYPVLFSKEDEIVAVINSCIGVEMVKFNIQNRDVEFEILSCVWKKPMFGLRGILFDAVLHVESLVSLEEEQQQQ